MSAGNFATLVELVESSVAQFARRPLFGERRDGKWQWTTYGEWKRRVDALRAGLMALGIGPGDRVAIVSRNSAAWAEAAYATYGIGAAFIPMYEQQRPEDWEFILRDSGTAVVFGRTPEIAATLRGMQARLPALHHVLTIEGAASDPASMFAVESHGRIHPAPPHAVSPDDVAAIVYTSGTTGLPKGVMLSHANLASNVAGTLGTFPMTATDRTLSFLPWAHVYGQVVELHILIGAGGSTAFNTDINKLIEELREVRPTILVAVPRIFNKLHQGVRAQMAERPHLIRRIFERGLAASIRRRRGEQISFGDRVMLILAGVLFYAIRKKLGGRLRYAVSGSATLSREVAEFIDGLGIEVYEGYGLTETSPIVSFNRPGQRKMGSVGLPLDGVTVTIDDTWGEAGEGEIVVHGPNVMKGYHARPDENARAFTADGGLRTGDLGRIDSDGYLFITGRIKEQYKLENGKYVMPTPLEERLALSPFIRTVMLHGASKPYNVALVAFDVDAVKHWAADNDIQLGSDLCRDPAVIALIQHELENESKDFRNYERPRACVLTDTVFTVENGLLTPTLKLKRREVLARFGPALDALYEKPLPPIVPERPAVSVEHRS